MFGRKRENKNPPPKSGPMSQEDIDHAKDLIQEIGEQKAKGYVMVVKVLGTDETDGSLNVDGHLKVSGVDRDVILSGVFSALNIDKRDAQEILMAYMMSDNVD